MVILLLDAFWNNNRIEGPILIYMFMYAASVLLCVSSEDITAAYCLKQTAF